MRINLVTSVVASALLAGLWATSCTSSKSSEVVSVIVGDPGLGGGGYHQDAGIAGAPQGGLDLILPDADLPPSGGSAGDDTVLPPDVMPPGFTAANMFGGFKVGAPIDGSAGGSDSGGKCGATILSVIRDFKSDGKNFEGPNINDDRGLVKPVLGDDRKPVWAVTAPTATVGDPSQLDAWFHNVDGVNKPYKMEFWFQPNNGVYSFQSTAFFPINDLGWGNEGRDENFHFTTEIHTQFKYKGGETFHFTGDDDVWVFVNKQLIIDLGGVHPAENASVDIDAQAAKLGLEIDKVYPFDMFQTERHTDQSNFRADTNLNFVDCGIIVPDIPK